MCERTCLQRAKRCVVATPEEPSLASLANYLFWRIHAGPRFYTRLVQVLAALIVVAASSYWIYAKKASAVAVAQVASDVGGNRLVCKS